MVFIVKESSKSQNSDWSSGGLFLHARREMPAVFWLLCLLGNNCKVSALL